MLGYICKYTPVEIFESMGETMKKIEPEAASFQQADTKMHPNICSFAKGVLEDVLDHDYDGIILTTCCDSIRRLYDVLKDEFPDKFIYILDVPRIINDAGVRLYEKRIMEMMEDYRDFSGKEFSEDALEEVLKKIKEEQEPTNITPQKDKIKVGILGARANQNIHKILRDHHVQVLFDDTCTGLERKILLNTKQVFHSYCTGLLSQFPCMRMQQASNRDRLLSEQFSAVDGIIYHTVQFCDNYSYEYAWLKQQTKKPLLLLETDYTKQSYGQILTRMEAFLESLKKTPEKMTEKRKAGIKSMYVMGVDSGSTSTNAVIMDQNRKIKAFSVVRTGAKSGESAQKILEEVLKKAGITKSDLSWIVSTGYGRVSIPYADEDVTEISCHGRGAHYFQPSIRTILDIGGQDSKAIALNDQGEVTDFVMNDKCAAGTGRFLEMIARSLEISIDELGPIALKSTEKIEITSMCSVFAESEVISLIAQNKEKADIANGICHSIANKSYSLLKRVGLREEFMMTGGVAKNPGVVRAVEEKIKSKLHICPEPEIVGATGAALYALDHMMQN